MVCCREGSWLRFRLVSGGKRKRVWRFRCNPITEAKKGDLLMQDLRTQVHALPDLAVSGNRIDPQRRLPENVITWQTWNLVKLVSSGLGEVLGVRGCAGSALGAFRAPRSHWVVLQTNQRPCSKRHQDCRPTWLSSTANHRGHPPHPRSRRDGPAR